MKKERALNDIEMAALRYELAKQGFPRHMKGYFFLYDAVCFYLEHGGYVAVSKEIYPYLAKKYGCSVTSVEKAIRSVARRAAEKSETDLLSNKALIACISESVRPACPLQ